MHLRNLGILGLFLLIVAGQCTAQVRGDNYHGHGYAYAAPAGFSAGGNTLTAIALGAGGEAILYKGLAAGADIGWQGPTESFRNGFGLASFNGAYHFVSSQHERRFVPFVTAATRDPLPTRVARTSPITARVSNTGSKRTGLSALRVATISTPVVRLHTRGRSASRSSSANPYNLLSPG